MPQRHSISCFLIMTLTLLAGSTLSAFAIDRSVRLQKPQMLRGATPSKTFTPTAIRKSMRTLAPMAAWKQGDPIKEIPRRSPHPPNRFGKRTPIFPAIMTRDPLLSQQETMRRAFAVPALSGPVLNIDGQTFTGAFPPDTVGDVGPRFYIQMVNSTTGAVFNIYDKNTGQVVVGPVLLKSLGTGVCADGEGDPIVLYDRMAERWMLSEFAPQGDDTLCVYISETSDPTEGSWFAYNFEAENGFPDYPKYGVWPDAYYLASNESRPTVYAFDRNAMLAGQTATYQSFSTDSLSGFNFQALIPSDLDGPNAPPADSPNYFMRHIDDEVHDPQSNDPSRDFLEIFEFHADFTDPNNATLTGPITVPISEFESDLCGLESFSCFAQPSNFNPLDPLREVVMWRLQYRSFNDHQTLVGNFVTDVNGADRGGIRWFELRKAGDSDWQLFQEGTYALTDDHNRWMGSIAMDGNQNIALGYSVGGSTLEASIRYTGRQASDPPGTMPEPEHTIRSGEGSTPSVRWGDYSSMSVDPTNDCSFWSTNAYAKSGEWGTQIANFSFDGCEGGDSFTLHVPETTQEVCSGNSLEGIPITINQVGNFTNDVTLTYANLPTGISGTFSPSSVTPPGSSSASLQMSETVAVGTYPITINGSAADTSHKQTTTNVPVVSIPTTVNLSTPVNNAQDQSLTPTFSWNAVSGANNYIIEIATDNVFGNIVKTATVSQPSYTIDSNLSENIQYFWRVKAINNCGGDENALPFNFTTAGAGPSEPFCRTPDEAIESNTSISDQLTITKQETISDLNVFLDIAHTYVGDLKVTLKKVGEEPTVVLLDQPGFPSGFGCSEDNIQVTLDDEAGNSAEDTCASSPPTIQGTLKPNQALNALDRKGYNGVWELTVSDLIGGDEGVLNKWCVLTSD